MSADNDFASVSLYSQYQFEFCDAIRFEAFCNMAMTYGLKAMKEKITQRAAQNRAQDKIEVGKA